MPSHPRSPQTPVPVSKELRTHAELQSMLVLPLLGLGLGLALPRCPFLQQKSIPSPSGEIRPTLQGRRWVQESEGPAALTCPPSWADTGRSGDTSRESDHRP